MLFCLGSYAQLTHTIEKNDNGVISSVRFSKSSDGQDIPASEVIFFKEYLNFPLRGIIKCWCGRHMTAGWTKGKSKYYLYYRCTKHVEKNVSGPWLHQQMEDTLSLLSLKSERVQYIIKATESRLKGSLAYRDRESQAKVKYMREIDSKVEILEQRFMEDQIEPVAYKKWHRKYSEKRAIVESELLDLQRDKNQDWRRIKEALPHLLSLPTLYANATVTQKHALLNGVFKHGLTFSGDRVRTPSINPVFSHNVLEIKQKGLIDIDQSAMFWDENPVCTLPRANIEPFFRGFRKNIPLGNCCLGLL